MTRPLLGFACGLALGAIATASWADAVSETTATPRLLLVGPVEEIDARKESVTVLGQKLPLSALRGVEVGASVSVFGHLRADGAITVAAVEHNGPYVPGASHIFLTGIVQKITPAVGQIVVAGLKADITSLTSPNIFSEIDTGRSVQLLGLQPNHKGLVLAQCIGACAIQGISGGSVQGISGGSVQGISGGSER